MKFSDGMEVETDGPLRTIEKTDGWSVVGERMLNPVKSKE